MYNGLIGYEGSKIESMLNEAIARKADTITTGTNITAYDLQPLLQGLYAVMFPFVSRCPRVVSKIGGTSTNWKQLTAVNSTNVSLGVSEGNRNANMQLTVKQALALYKSLGLEADLTFEAEEAAQGFDDARARRTESLLNAVRMGEEKVVLFGNGDSTLGVSLGTPNTPVVAANATSGTLPAATYYAWIVALSYEGYQNASISGGVATTITRNNVDGSSDTLAGGSSNVSASSNSYTLGAPGSVGISWAPTQGAFGYAVYLGTSKATAVLTAIVPVAYPAALPLVISAPGSGTQVATAITADNSVNSLLFTGMIPQILQPGSGAYVKSLQASLTSDGAGGIVEWDAALLAMYNNYKQGVHRILISAYDHLKASDLILKNGGAPLIRFTQAADGAGEMGKFGGSPFVTEYYNKFTGERIQLETHPFIPQGMTIGYAERMNPEYYLAANVPTPFRILCRTREWYEIEWPVTSRKRAHGQYVSELFQYSAPFSSFAITDQQN